MLDIGRVQLAHPFVQAALSGYSDLPMRRIARRCGASYALNEVVLDKLVLQRGKKQRVVMDVPPDDHPVGGQLMGSDPDVFAPAAAAMAQAGYDVIDINFGCPVSKVLGRCRGGYMLSQPAQAIEIVRHVIEAVGRTHPVTVKMRRGMDDSPESERSFFTILDGAFELGASAVTVHGRTVRQKYVGASNWAFLARVKRHVGGRTILGSGDLFDAPACVRMMRETGVDGVTIARGCIGNPWIFADCVALWRGEPLPPPPSVPDQGRVIAEHFRETVDHVGEQKAGHVMRKFGIKYSELHPGGLAVRDAFIRATTTAEFQRVLDEWYAPDKSWPATRRREGSGDLIAAGACD
ncbi:MAG: tRNA-dihydrouridine synthase [Phycisphaerales bacterium]|nr:tRNA-dihydrouridine synthase [Phycisphaerales bacterium]